MHRSGAHCLVGARKRGNARRAKGAGHPRQDGVNGQPEELLVLAEADRLPRGGTSRMRRESHVRNLWGTRGANPRVYPATSTVKRRDIRSRHVGIRETNANEPPTTHRNTTRTTSKPELPASAGSSMAETTYWSCDVRCTGGVTLVWAFARNLRTWLAR